MGCCEEIVVDVEEEDLRQEVGLSEASILVNCFPIEDAEVDMARNVGWHDEGDTEEHMTKERAWTMIEELEDTKIWKVPSNLNFKEDIVHLACPVDMDKGLGASSGWWNIVVPSHSFLLGIQPLGLEEREIYMLHGFPHI